MFVERKKKFHSNLKDLKEVKKGMTAGRLGSGENVTGGHEERGEDAHVTQEPNWGEIEKEMQQRDERGTERERHPQRARLRSQLLCSAFATEC